MSLGRVSTFLDIYIERDIKEGVLTEVEAQELVDDLIIKLRVVRFLRTHDYNALFSGDPTLGDRSHRWCRHRWPSAGDQSSFRFLHTLTNLGPAPEPSLTVLWSHLLPKGFKDYCAEQSISSSFDQLQNDDLMRTSTGVMTTPSPVASRQCVPASRCSSLAPASTWASTALRQRRPRRNERQADHHAVRADHRQRAQLR